MKRTHFLYDIKGCLSQLTGWELTQFCKNKHAICYDNDAISLESKQLTENIGDLMTIYNDQRSGWTSTRADEWNIYLSRTRASSWLWYPRRHRAKNIGVNTKYENLPTYCRADGKNVTIDRLCPQCTHVRIRNIPEKECKNKIADMERIESIHSAQNNITPPPMSRRVWMLIFQLND